MLLEYSLIILLLAVILGGVIPDERYTHVVSSVLVVAASIILSYISIKELLYLSEPICIRMLSGLIEIPLIIDKLTAIFILIFSSVYILVSVYSIGYIHYEYIARGYKVRLYSIAYPSFLTSMLLIMMEN